MVFNLLAYITSKTKDLGVLTDGIQLTNALTCFAIYMHFFVECGRIL